MLKVTSFTQQSTPLRLRERLSIESDAWATAYQSGRQWFEELCVLHTCGRTTFIYVGDAAHLQSWVQQTYGIDASQVQTYGHTFKGEAALSHLMRVACGLESAILGEPQILGQLKQAYACALTHQGVGPMLRRVMPAVFQAAKSVRTDTRIGCSPLALASVVFELTKRVFDDLAQVSICLVGAGETIERHLAYAKRFGFANVHVVNRSIEGAQRLVQAYGGQAHALSQLPDVLATVDCVVSATAHPLPFIGKGLMERIAQKRAYRPMLCVDLAMPRDMEPEIATIEGIYVYNIEDLHRQIEAHRHERAEHVQDAQVMIKGFVKTLSDQLTLLHHVETIRAFRRHIESSRDASVQAALAELAKGAPPAKIIEQALYQFAQKMMHRPTKALRKAAQQQKLDVLDCAATLFTHEDLE